MDFRIADTFTDSLTRLNGHEQKAAKITAIDLQMDPSAPGLQFHKIDKSKDTNFWSLRVNRDLRIVVHRTPGSILLCYVAHHDKAYTWAERRRIEAHPRTGTIQIVEIRERVEEVSPDFNYPAGAKRNGRASASAFRRTVAEAFCSASAYRSIGPKPSAARPRTSSSTSPTTSRRRRPKRSLNLPPPGAADSTGGGRATDLSQLDSLQAAPPMPTRLLRAALTRSAVSASSRMSRNSKPP